MAQLIDTAPDSTESRADTRSGASSTTWSLAIGLAWPASLTVMTLLEPRAEHIGGVSAVVGHALYAVFMVLLLATLCMAATRHRLMAPLSLGASAAAMALTIACPLSGHHPHVGAWWYAQMAISAGMIALSAAALYQRERA